MPDSGWGLPLEVSVVSVKVELVDRDVFMWGSQSEKEPVSNGSSSSCSCKRRGWKKPRLEVEVVLLMVNSVLD